MYTEMNAKNCGKRGPNLKQLIVGDHGVDLLHDLEEGVHLDVAQLSLVDLKIRFHKNIRFI
jgi:hypothetical protein